MKTLLTAVAAIALTTVLPAQATTFSLRTIYIASGVFDDGSAADAGAATTVLCSNVSGKTATLKVTFYGTGGTLEGTAGPFSVLNLHTWTFSTHSTFFSGEAIANTGAVQQGVLNVSSTESGVFCSAMIVDAASGGPTPPFAPQGIELHMVRYNPHPGTVE